MTVTLKVNLFKPPDSPFRIRQKRGFVWHWLRDTPIQGFTDLLKASGEDLKVPLDRYSFY